jgi:hypothetical protein
MRDLKIHDEVSILTVLHCMISNLLFYRPVVRVRKSRALSRILQLAKYTISVDCVSLQKLGDIASSSFILCENPCNNNVIIMLRMHDFIGGMFTDRKETLWLSAETCSLYGFFS